MKKEDECKLYFNLKLIKVKLFCTKKDRERFSRSSNSVKKASSPLVLK